MFSNKILEEIVLNAIEITPGLSRGSGKNSIVVDSANKIINVSLSCMYAVNYYEVMLMFRNLVFHLLSSYTWYADYKVNVCLESFW